ncbi:MAG: FGGY-family carbohydrate kinase [Leucobacter sp.]
MPLLPTITVDIGTTSVKVCAFDENAALLASDRHATPTETDAWGDVYDVDALMRVVIDFARGLDEAVRGTIQRIAITGVGESGGLVRPDLTLASPMILWHDHRGAEVLTRLSAQDHHTIYAITGLPANANYGLSKAVWAKERLASDDVSGTQWLNIAEYVAALMSNERWAEPSLASRTMALDVASGDWSPEVCALVGLSPDVFPELRPATQGAALTAEFARDTGLGDDVRVHVAGHDHMVGAVGAGLVPGELLGSTGTTEGVLVLNEQPSLGSHAERSMLANGVGCAGTDYTLFASIPTGGSAFETLQHMLGIDAGQLTGRIADLYDRYMAGRIDLARTPVFLPQFRGSPPPTKDASARGIIAGLASDTTADELIFGCFVGLALQYRDVLNLFGVEPSVVKVIGPASRNPLWLQLKADLLRTPLSVSSFPEVVSRGAQALASGVAAAAWQANDPYEVRVDESRANALQAWYQTVRPKWEYMWDFPS